MQLNAWQLKGIKYCWLGSIETFFFSDQQIFYIKSKVSRFFCSIGFLYRKVIVKHPLLFTCTQKWSLALSKCKIIVSDSKRYQLGLIMQLVTFYWETDIFPVVWEEKEMISLWSLLGQCSACEWGVMCKHFRGGGLSLYRPWAAVCIALGIVTCWKMQDTVVWSLGPGYCLTLGDFFVFLNH